MRQYLCKKIRRLARLVAADVRRCCPNPRSTNGKSRACPKTRSSGSLSEASSETLSRFILFPTKPDKVCDKVSDKGLKMLFWNVPIFGQHARQGGSNSSYALVTPN